MAMMVMMLMLVQITNKCGLSSGEESVSAQLQQISQLAAAASVFRVLSSLSSWSWTMMMMMSHGFIIPTPPTTFFWNPWSLVTLQQLASHQEATKSTKQQNYQIEGISHPLSSHLSWRKYSVIWRSFRLNTLIISAKWCFLWRECVQFVNKLYIWCGDEFSYNFVLCRQITISMYNMYTLYKVCSTCAVFQYSFKQLFRRICEWCKNLVPPRIHAKDKVAESSQGSSPLVEDGFV